MLNKMFNQRTKNIKSKYRVEHARHDYLCLTDPYMCVHFFLILYNDGHQQDSK